MSENKSDRENLIALGEFEPKIWGFYQVYMAYSYYRNAKKCKDFSTWLSFGIIKISSPTPEELARCFFNTQKVPFTIFIYDNPELKPGML